MIYLLLSCALAVSLPSAQSGAEPAREWTLLFYGASDNNSEESFVPDMQSAMKGLPLAGIDVLAFVDRSPKYSKAKGAFFEDFSDARLYRLNGGESERLAGGEAFPEITLTSNYEANSGDALTLRKALRWAKQTSPAKHYAVIFYSHGGGDSWCPDETSGNDLLYPAELTDVLEHSDSLDLMIFDVCLMGAVENAYQWRPTPDKFGVDVMVATPMAGFPFPWERIFGEVAKAETLSPSHFGELIVGVVEEGRYEDLYRDGLPEWAEKAISLESMGCYDLSQAASVKRHTDQLAVELARIPAAKDALGELRGSGEVKGLMNYMGAGAPNAWASYPYFDLYDLARRIPDLDCATPALIAAAKALGGSVEAMVLASFGMPGYEEFGFVPGANGLSILLPDGEKHWKQHFKWYSPLEVKGKGYGKYGWCADGSLSESDSVGNWYGLLHAWYGD
ncbi:MAG: clostripain [Planctomycetota bacterium]|jgi:clostripain